MDGIPHCIAKQRSYVCPLRLIGRRQIDLPAAGGTGNLSRPFKPPDIRRHLIIVMIIEKSVDGLDVAAEFRIKKINVMPVILRVAEIHAICAGHDLPLS